MLPINGARPTGTNSTGLAIHARLIGEQRSSRKRIARGYASVPVPTHQLCEERQLGGYDWT